MSLDEIWLREPEIQNLEVQAIYNEMYSKIPWVMQYLEGCSNTELDFENWMKRDYLFADSVLKDATKLGYSTLVVDGERTIDENLDIIEEVFKVKCRSCLPKTA
ncbi:hypothetical protein [Ruminiclostridium josui]|uniref:hypothetical protein n=1 Tax=Ruminiclostridium josui TaxID=1499 RepID=UPI000465BF06|nr:hypothetical protein [Ruminiclostridium josui]